MAPRCTTRVRLALAVAIAVTASGFFAMHALSMVSTVDTRAVEHSMHDTTQDIGTTVRSAVTVSMPDPNVSHLHDALDCVWILVTMILVFAVFTVVARRRQLIQTALLHTSARQGSGPGSRAPPTSTRLSLVGTARC